MKVKITRPALPAPRGANMPRMQQAEGTARNAVTYANLWLDGRWLHDAGVTIAADGTAAAVNEIARARRRLLPESPSPAWSTRIATLFNACSARGRSTARGSGTISGAGARPCTPWLGRLQRDDLEAIAARCYLELLRGGYTSVAEFLYLHRLGDRRELDADLAIARRRPEHGDPAHAAACPLPACRFRRRGADAGATAVRARDARSSWKTGRSCAGAILREATSRWAWPFTACAPWISQRWGASTRHCTMTRCAAASISMSPNNPRKSPPVCATMAPRGGAAGRARPAVGALGTGARTHASESELAQLRAARRHAGAVPHDRGRSRRRLPAGRTVPRGRWTDGHRVRQQHRPQCAR